jgi:hypothetical protein
MVSQPRDLDRCLSADFVVTTELLSLLLLLLLLLLPIFAPVRYLDFHM